MVSYIIQHVLRGVLIAFTTSSGGTVSSPTSELHILTPTNVLSCLVHLAVGSPTTCCRYSYCVCCVVLLAWYCTHVLRARNPSCYTAWEHYIHHAEVSMYRILLLLVRYSMLLLAIHY